MSCSSASATALRVGVKWNCEKQRKQREIDPLLSSLRRCKEQLSGPFGDDDDQGRARRINDLWKFLTMVDSLAQRFFASQRGLRAAIEILAQDDN